MKVIVFVIVLVGSSELEALRCHATPKINFCHLRNPHFAISKITLSTILLALSENYFLLSTMSYTILLYAEKS